MLLSFFQFSIALFIMTGFGILVISLKPINFSVLERWIISIVVGFLSWSLLIYATSWLHIRLLATPVVILMSLFGWWRYKSSLLPKSIPRIPFWVPLVVVLGMIGQLTLVFNSGLTTAEGIGFYGINFHDGLWHVSLMETLQKQFPPIVPTYANVPLQGYHYIVDLIGSELSSQFGLSPMSLVFRYFPGMFSCLAGLGIYAVMRRLTTSKTAQFVGVFLSYFGGSFSFILPLLRLNLDAGESSFWSQQSISTFINLPLGVSFAMMVAMFLLVLIWIRDKSTWSLFLAAMISGSLVSVKAYAGLLAMIGFCGLLLFQFVKKRRKELIVAFLTAIVLATSLTISQLKSGEGTFLWSPGWFLKTMMEAPDRVNYPEWEKIRQVYSEHNNIPRLVEYWGIAFAVFLIGNFGMRSLGLLNIFSIKNNSRTTDGVFFLFLVVITLSGIVIPTFFLQAGVVWNTIQFTYYSLFIMSIFTGLFVARLPRTINLIVALLVVLFSLPSNINTLSGYIQKYRNNDVQLITNDAVAALRYLKNTSTTEVVFAGYSDNSFVPAISGLSTYYADETQAIILLLDHKERAKELGRFMVECRDEPEFEAYINDNRIAYIYLDTQQFPDCLQKYLSFPSLKNVYNNDTIYVLKHQ